MYIAISEYNSNLSEKTLRIHKLWSGLILDNKSNNTEEEELKKAMSIWMGRNTSTQIQQIFKLCDNTNRK